MNSVFSEQILADKLSKLNSTQQCIETLSHWCIFHQSKAEVVVTTWNKQFHNSQIAQKIPLLYLANDILQNSKRKGNEFVTEFWKVLPAAVKDLNENGDDQGKGVVTRLVKIWEERRVFGSRARNLREVMLGGEAPPPLELGKKRSRSVKIVRRDSRSIKTKLSIGGSAEKIVSAFHLVFGEQSTEDSEMSRCKAAINRVRKMEHDVDIACAQVKDPKRKILAKELEDEENVLKECMEKFKSIEASRAVLVTQLREALQEQESELENIRTQMQVAQAQAEEANNMRKRLNDENYTAATSTPGNAHADLKSKRSAADIAAMVADKLTASSSSQLIMSSVLSTFAAEEAKNASLTSTTSNSYPVPPVTSTPKAMPKPEQPASVSDVNGFMPSQSPLSVPPHPYVSPLIPQPTLQSPSPGAQSQCQLLPNTPEQYAQTPRVVTTYGYGNLPPLPSPMPPHVMGPMMPLPQTLLQVNQQMGPMMQQSSPSPQTPLQMNQQMGPMMQQSSPLPQTLLQMNQQMGPMMQQSAPLPQQQSMMLMQPPPGNPNFRPLQPPGMMYFSQPYHLQ